MGFLKKLFGGREQQQNRDNGLYFYFRAARSGEVIQIRLNPGSDISMDDSNTYYARKHIVGPKSFERLEAELHFRKKGQMGFQLVSCDVTGGEIVEREDYDAYLAEKEA